MTVGHVEVEYERVVSSDVDTPLTPGRYRMRIVEGGTYRNLASRRKYTICEINPVLQTIRYEYVRGDGEPVERTGQPYELAVIEAVEDTPRALLAVPEAGGSG